MSLVIISIDRSELPPHTREQFEKWVQYRIGQIDKISLSNPLHDIDMRATVREWV